ncbi:hypothetical protein [Candidatus Protochlamydia phocaeensis]|uniref:hypothetical protein n=1 Tax=Candidatus Protochlamydia phocaeensis TaxID=1414722 RepID=UPI000838426D|nr:hypothetical protein [Candidatus Protochlamydia phocaeensis]
MSPSSSLQSLNNQFCSCDNFSHFILHWTPRAVVAGVAGLYSLGFAYDIGLMAAIDRIAIRILRYFVGYIGVGAAMPTVQWYSAWAVRLSAALLAGIIYDLCERIIRYAIRHFFPVTPPSPIPIRMEERFNERI